MKKLKFLLFCLFAFLISISIGTYKYGMELFKAAAYLPSPLPVLVTKTGLLLGADVNVKDEYGATPLINACMVSNYALTAYLLERGANINLKDKRGVNALSYAILSENTHQNFNIANLLIKNSIEIDSKDNVQGKTPLYYAVYKGKEGMIELLLKSGANGNIKNKKGISPCTLVYKKQNSKISELFNSFASPKCVEH